MSSARAPRLPADLPSGSPDSHSTLRNLASALWLDDHTLANVPRCQGIPAVAFFQGHPSCSTPGILGRRDLPSRCTGAWSLPVEDGDHFSAGPATLDLLGSKPSSLWRMTYVRMLS